MLKTKPHVSRMLILLFVAVILGIVGLYFWLTSSELANALRPRPTVQQITMPQFVSGPLALGSVEQNVLHADSVRIGGETVEFSGYNVSVTFDLSDNLIQSIDLGMQVNSDDEGNIDDQVTLIFERTGNSQYAAELESENPEDIQTALSSVPFATLATLPRLDIEEGSNWNNSFVVRIAGEESNVMRYESTMSFTGFVTHEDQTLSRFVDSFTGNFVMNGDEEIPFEGTATYYFNPFGDIMGGRHEGSNLPSLIGFVDEQAGDSQSALNFHSHAK